jgi:hypothetical protein
MLLAAGMPNSKFWVICDIAVQGPPTGVRGEWYGNTNSETSGGDFRVK